MQGSRLNPYGDGFCKNCHMIDLNLKKVPSNVLLSKDARHDTASSKSTEWSTKLWTSSTCVNTHKSVKKVSSTLVCLTAHVTLVFLHSCTPHT